MGKRANIVDTGKRKRTKRKESAGNRRAGKERV